MQRGSLVDYLGLDAERVGAERFLVTGSEGCIGAWTVERLVTAGFYTVAADLPPAGRRLHKILDERFHGDVVHADADVTAREVLADLIAEHRITRVIHLAALQVPFVFADPILGAQVNVTGTVRVLEAARGSAGQVRRVAYASSTAAAGSDDSPHTPETLYGAFKLCNEHTARLYARDFDTCALGLRPCVVYGPGRDQGLTAALTHALKAAVLEVPYELPFGGFVDLQYAPDVASAFIATALADDDAGVAVYDLHGDHVSVEDYLAMVAEAVPGAERLLTVAGDAMPGKVDVDDSDLVQRVGALPKTSLPDGIRLSLETFRRHRELGLLSEDELPLS